MADVEYCDMCGENPATHIKFGIPNASPYCERCARRDVERAAGAAFALTQILATTIEELRVSGLRLDQIVQLVNDVADEHARHGGPVEVTVAPWQSGFDHDDRYVRVQEVT